MLCVLTENRLDSIIIDSWDLRRFCQNENRLKSRNQYFFYPALRTALKSLRISQKHTTHNTGHI